MKCTAEQLEAFSQDSRYHDLGTLPSNGIPYKGRMDALFIRPFHFPELQLLSRSAQLNEVSHLIRAVNNCITHDVYDLTIGDFYYVLLWLRMYSMPKSPYIIPWHCTQPFFVHKETRAPLFYSKDCEWPTMDVLTTDYDESICNTHNTSVVQKTDLEILMLKEGQDLPEGFDYPRTSILADLTEATMDPDFSFLVAGIQWIQATPEPGQTMWQAKIARLEENPELLPEAFTINSRVVHGISENATFFCNKCRITHTQKLRLNASTFFQ